MQSLRSSLMGLAVVVVALAFVGCSTAPRHFTAIPSDLPADPETCTKYCKVWVPPVYRDVPRLVQKTPGRCVEVPETVCETRYREVCVRPRCQYEVETDGKRCEQAVVQTRPGGYKWKRDGDCWRYCYEEPCFEWCNKVVTEEGIKYCMEVPPKYRVEVTHEPVTRYRTVYQEPEWCVEWDKEVYRPGRWEWQPTKECERCDCPAPCPPVQYKKSPCPPGADILTERCPPCN